MVWDGEKGGCKPGIVARTSEVKVSATDTFNICMAIEEAEMYTASTYFIGLITCLCFVIRGQYVV